MDANRQYTEEEMRLCPHLRKRVVVDSPFKEKITINSESEATPAKQRLDSEEDLPAECSYSKVRAQKASSHPPAPTSVSPAEAVTKDTSDDEDDQPSGGCPMMGTNIKKRNPGYSLPEVIESLVYVSPFASILESPNVFAPQKKGSAATKRWDTYPMFLKHTLVYMGENYDKYRALEVGYKFFVTDELREKGNVCFRKGQFAEALSHYEKAASIMRWLEFTPDDFVLQMKKLPKLNLDPASFSEDMTVEDIAKLKQKSVEAGQGEQTGTGTKEVKDQKYWDERMSDLMLTSFTDANVRLVEGVELKEKADRDIHDNILFQLYSNMAMCYLGMKCMAEARQAIAEMGRIKSDSSLFLIRQAQVSLADKMASLEDIQTAREGMRQAIELKKSERIYEHNSNFLRIFSLENHETIFGDMLGFADTRMAERKAQIKERIRRVLKRAKQVEEAEQNIISRGLVPEEGKERTLLLFSQDDNFEEKLMEKMTEKYRQAIFFFSASEKTEDAGQVDIAQRCLAKQNELREEVEMLWRFDFGTQDRTIQGLIAEVNAEVGVNLEGEKVQRRLQRIQREQARELIERYPFDLRLFEHVIQEIFKGEKKAEKTKKRQEMEEATEGHEEEPTAVKKGLGFGFAAQVLGVALFLLLVAYFGKTFIFQSKF
jgi:tetratricopeptide (TPR) repeat protein